MPRIAVAVGVVALIAFSIGFNTARYTVVWEMVGGPSQHWQPSQPLSSASAPQPTTVAKDAAVAGTSADAEKEGTADRDRPGPAAGQEQQSGPPTEGPPGVYAAELATPSASVPQLARVQPPDGGKDAAAGVDSGGEIRRLPPVDQVAPYPADRRLERTPRDPILLYPGTGT